MNSRDAALISSATLIGAVASAIVIRFFFNNPKQQQRHQSSKDSTSNGATQHKNVSPPSPFDPSKRQGYISWDDYFMAIAFLSAQRSKDPNRQVGACLVSQNGVILGIGYNGFPRGCSDDKLPWAKKSKNDDPLETKYPYVCHAEVNAILNTNHASAAGQKLYVSMFPCNECAKIIIQVVPSAQGSRAPTTAGYGEGPNCTQPYSYLHKEAVSRVLYVNKGVSEVIYFVEKRLPNSDKCYIASHKLLSMAGVKVRKHQPQMDQISIKFEEP